MDKDKLLEVANDVKNRSNKELVESRDILIEEFNKTKELIIDLTRHLEMVEIFYNNINKEIEKRTKWN